MNQNRVERGPERILTREEVIATISSFIDNSAIKIEKTARELSDEKGLYLLEVEIKGKEEAETL